MIVSLPSPPTRRNLSPISATLEKSSWFDCQLPTRCTVAVVRPPLPSSTVVALMICSMPELAENDWKPISTALQPTATIASTPSVAAPESAKVSKPSKS